MQFLFSYFFSLENEAEVRAEIINCFTYLNIKNNNDPIMNKRETFNETHHSYLQVLKNAFIHLFYLL